MGAFGEVGVFGEGKRRASGLLSGAIAHAPTSYMLLLPLPTSLVQPLFLPCL